MYILLCNIHTYDCIYFLYVCIYTHIYIWIKMCTYIAVCVCECVCACVCVVCGAVFVCMLLCVFLHQCVSLCPFDSLCVCVCLYVCLLACVHTCFADLWWCRGASVARAVLKFLQMDSPTRSTHAHVEIRTHTRRHKTRTHGLHVRCTPMVCLRGCSGKR